MIKKTNVCHTPWKFQELILYKKESIMLFSAKLDGCSQGNK